MRILCLSLAACVALCGCSKKPVIQECVDEFVQEFEVTVPGWVVSTPICKESAKQLSSPEEYRNRVSSIRVEYSEDDYYLVQTDRYWKISLGKPGEDDPKFCHDVTRAEQVTRQRYVDEELETEVTVDGEKRRASYPERDNVLFGEARLTNPGWQDATRLDDPEDTDFKLRCAMTVRQVVPNLRTRACMPVEPTQSCAAVRHMLPIHQEGRTEFGILMGKTTKLEMGPVGTLVDREKWMMDADSESDPDPDTDTGSDSDGQQ